MHAFAAGPKPVDREHAEVCMMYQCAWLKNTNCIWDRFTGISNVCNLPELADEDIPMHAHYFKVAMQDAVIIMCTAENMDDHILEPYETSTDEAQILQDRIIILNNYAKFTHELPNVIRYDFKVRKLDSLIQEIDHAFSIDIS
jgi:hypothetical protein